MEIWHWILWGLAIIGLFVLKRAVQYLIMPRYYGFSEYQIDRQYRRGKERWKEEVEYKLRNNDLHEIPFHSRYNNPETPEIAAVYGDDLEWKEEMKRKYNI
jgi:hypothetical protein